MDPRGSGAQLRRRQSQLRCRGMAADAPRDELLSRLDLLRTPPGAVLDLGAGTGLAARRDQAALSPRARSPRRTSPRPCSKWRADAAASGARSAACEADARALPFDDASFDLVFSNLMLQWLQPPDAALARDAPRAEAGRLAAAQQLRAETLRELRAAWAAADGGVHVNEFIDVHDLGSALARAGFIEPVLDVDRASAPLRRRARPDARTEGTGRPQPANRSAPAASPVVRAFGRMNAAYECSAPASRVARDLAGGLRRGLGTRTRAHALRPMPPVKCASTSDSLRGSLARRR